MKLTTEQIDQLYAFTIKHYVEYYDLQTELVDHLANAIEQQWQENPKLSFDEALNVEFKKFGVFGFTGLVEKREEALNKKYNRIVLQYLKEFFKLPKIIGTVGLIWICHFLLKQFQFVESLIAYIAGGLLIVFIIGLIVLTRKEKMQVKQTGKKWLFKKIIQGYGSYSFYGYLVFRLGLGLTKSDYEDWVYWYASFVLILIALLIYIVLFLIPSKAEQYLKETYPEYEISK